MNLLILFSHYDREYEPITFNFVIMLYFLVMLRSVNVGAKYATFTRAYRDRLLSRYITDEEQTKWNLLGPWDAQDNHVVKREINYAMRRKMIDASTFKVSFIDPPSKLIADALTDSKVLGDYCKGHANYKIPGSEGFIQYYDCRSLVYNLLAIHTQSRKNNVILPIAIFCTLLWFCLPGLTRLLVGLNYCGTTWNHVIVFFVTSFFFMPLFFINFMFFKRAYYDYDRIDFLNNQLWQMLSPTKVPTVENKIFPTINIADPISLQAWINMRRMAFDYGINFHSRHRIFIPMCFIFAVAAFVFIAFKRLVLFGQAEHVITICQLLFLYIVIVYGAFYVILVRQCMLINNSYKNHLCQIRENQQIYNSMHHFRDYYIKSNKDKEIPFDVNQIFNTIPKSLVHKQLSDWMATTLGDSFKFEQFCDPLVEKLGEMMDEFSKEIDRQYSYSPKTFLGRKVTFAVFGMSVFFYIIGVVGGYLLAIENRRPIKLF
jgi:hypothetical protein